MDRHLLLILTLLTIGCSSSDNNQPKTNSTAILSDSNTNQDSLVLEMYKRTIGSKIAEPLDLSILAPDNVLDFTSGGSPMSSSDRFCDSDSLGFYGRYNLIDRRIIKGVPIAGHIDIFKIGKMSEWKSSDKNQRIWEIYLSTNILTVWDSISIGLPRQIINNFIHANNGFCIKKGDDLSCDFNNFGAIFKFKNDTLNELTITRSCK